jgi:mannitol-1-phosphate/altronate dehydrogenase
MRAAGRRDADWVAEHVAFPNSMVDRITPATTPQIGIGWKLSSDC